MRSGRGLDKPLILEVGHDFSKVVRTTPVLPCKSCF